MKKHLNGLLLKWDQRIQQQKVLAQRAKGRRQYRACCAHEATASALAQCCWDIRFLLNSIPPKGTPEEFQFMGPFEPNVPF
jgi:hypothetical protein